MKWEMTRQTCSLVVLAPGLLHVLDVGVLTGPAKGVPVAEEKAAAAEPTAAKSSQAPQAQKPILFIILLVFNMAVVGAVAVMLYMNRKKDEAKPSIDHVVQGEHEAQEKEKAKEEEFVGKLIPLETFVVNLAGSRGGKLAKVNMELEVNNEAVQEEIDKRKPQLRDIIIILLSSKTFEQISTKEGKDGLRDEIRDTINSFLTKGTIKRVYFTEFIFN